MAELMQKIIELSLQWIVNNCSIFWASIISFFICFLWESNINSAMRIKVSLSMMSALISLGVVSTMELLQIPEKTEPLIGVIIGLLGPNKIKAYVDNMLIEKMKNEIMK
ncbi:phage holin family protein [Yersinia sp. 2540 StPb PI]|uniref:phage holin family protein n=1 Tax=Yersinia sp. 2540 StPb PI TaxID=3117406 RepID=UPI003FA42C54